ASADATLRIPVIIDLGKNGIAAEAINKKLKKAGAKLIPNYIEISSKEDSYDKLKHIDAEISKSLSALGKDYKDVSRRSGNLPGDANLGGLKTCYKGSAKDVSEAVLNLAGSEYTEQMNIWGWKYKNITKILAEDSDIDLKAYLNQESKLWANWRGQGEAVLLLIAYSDDGDDVNEVILKRCE
ncbi:MAG: hypothetical protein AABZ55_10130, partial [Bdellovibrionota bacterium]